MTTPAVVRGAVPSGFDQVPQIRYRLYLPSLLGHPLLAVYDALRSTVWRQENFGPEELTFRAAKGILAAQPTQKQLAAITGLARETVNRSLRKLEKMGWVVDAKATGKGVPKVYELGTKHLDSFGGTESYYADAVMQGWYEAVDEASQASQRATFRSLPLQTQLGIVDRVLAPLRGGVTHHVGGVMPSTIIAAVRARQKGGVTVGSHPSDTGPRTLHFAPLLAVSEASAPPAGGCDPALTPPPDHTPSEGQFSASNTGVGGVITDHRGCDPIAHLTPTVRINNPAESLGIDKKDRAYIDSLHRISLTTLGRTLFSKESSQHYVWENPTSGREGGGVPCPPATASAPSSVFPHTPGTKFSAATENQSPTPTPVARPPAPAPSGRTSLPEDGSRVTSQPEEASVPVYRFNPSKTAPDPTEGASTRPDPVSGGLGAVVTDLASVVSEAKARSREAMEAKLAKRRSKERKAANLTSDAAYRGQKAGAQRLEQVWRDEMAAAFPDVPQIAWFKRERGKVLARKEGKLAADLLDGYGNDEAVVRDIIETYVRYWRSDYGPMLTKQNDSVPTFGLLYACHASVVAEAPKIKRRGDAVAQYEAWKVANAGNDFAVPPPELEAAYKAATLKKGKR